MIQRLVRNQHVLSLMVTASQWGLAFLAFIVLLRLYDSDKVGQWVIYMAFFSASEALRNGLVQNGFINNIIENREDVSRWRMAALTLSVGAGGLAYITILTLTIPISIILDTPLLHTLFIPYLAYVALSAPLKVLEYQWVARRRFDLLLVTRTVYGAVFLICLVSFDMSLVVLPLLQCACVAISLLISVIIAQRNSLKLRLGCDKELKQLFSFGRYVAGTNVSSIVLGKIDLFVIGAVLGPAAVAVYSAAGRLVNLLEVPLTGLAQSFYPKIALAHKISDSKATIAIHHHGVLMSARLIIPIALLLVIFARPLLELVAGENYAAGAIVLQILAAGSVVKCLGRFNGMTLDAIGFPDRNFKILLLSCGATLIFTVTLSNIMFLPGAALGVVLSMALGTALSWTALRKSMGTDFHHFIQFIMSNLFITSALGKRSASARFGASQSSMSRRMSKYPALGRMVSKLFGTTNIGQYARARVFREIIETVPLENYKAVLDIGCGQGEYSIMLGQENPHLTVTALDIEPERITKLRNISWESDMPNLCPHLGEVSTLPFDDHYDFIYSIDVFEHIDVEEMPFEAAMTKLRPGGLLLVKMPSRDQIEVLPRKWFADHHRWLEEEHIGQVYMLDGLIQRMEQEGFKIERAFYSDGWLSRLSWELGYLTKKAGAPIQLAFLPLLKLLVRFDKWSLRSAHGNTIQVVARKPK